MRAILRGEPTSEPSEDDLAVANRWLKSSLARWAELVAAAPAESSIRFPNGYFVASYRLTGNLNQLALPDLLEALRRAVIRHTGWPQFSVLTRQNIAPYIHDGIIECWVARDGEDHGPAHNDFWRAAPQANFFVIRGHIEDETRHGLDPKTVFDITAATWRVGEILLHAANMAVELGDPTAQVTLVARWTGLSGRHLTSLDGRRLVFGHHHAHQDVFTNSLAVQADQIGDSLPELVGKLVRPLYELFDFFRLPEALPSEELRLMRANRF